MKNTAKADNGALPSSANRLAPTISVMTSARIGESHAIVAEGCGRGSSRSMASTCKGFGRRDGRREWRRGPESTHPLADLFDRSFGRRDARREAAARHHDDAIADLEQLV